MAQSTLRQAIQTWRQRLELTGLGLVEAPLERWTVCDGSHDSGATIDATLARLAHLTPGEFTVELSYPWGREDESAGALLGIIPERCDEAIESWSPADAA